MIGKILSMSEENENPERELDKLRIVAFTPGGLIHSRWSKDEDEMESMAELVSNIQRLAVMEFPDDNDNNIYLPEGVIQRSVFRLEKTWK